MKILTFPNEQLRIQSSEVCSFDESIKKVTNDLLELMYCAKGIGIAAPQAGIHKRIILVDPSCGKETNKLVIMINPTIVKKTGISKNLEGCLSLPGVFAKIDRWAKIDVTYQNTNGEPLFLSADGMLSIVIQHEIDHLDGKLFIDHVKNQQLTCAGSMK